MGRPEHHQKALARYLFVEQGIADLPRIAEVTGISVKTLENYRGEDKWLDQQAQHRAGKESPLESLDDVAEAVTRLFFQKAQEYCDLPAELFDPSIAKSLRHMVETIKLLTADIRRMSARDKLLTMKEFLGYVLRQHAQPDPALLNLIFELVAGFSDEVLE
jgi:hypothetical protein